MCSALSSTGSFEASSPASQVLQRCATPRAPLAGLRCLRPTIPRGAAVVRSQRSRLPNRGPGVDKPDPGRQHTRGDRRGLPGSPTTLMSFCPVLRPRQDQHHQAIQCADMAPAMSTTKAPTIIQLSRLNHTASGLAVYASPGVLPHKTQNSLPAARQALPGGIGYPQGCAERFQCLKHLLLSGALPGARAFRICSKAPTCSMSLCR